jgi:hypothetical protein
LEDGLFTKFISFRGDSEEGSQWFHRFTVNNRVTVFEAERGRRELWDFVSRSLKELILLEEQRKQVGFSGMRLLCRLDIGVFWRESTRTCHFFLNKVTRNYATNFWAKHSSNPAAIFVSLADTLGSLSLVRLWEKQQPQDVFM